MIRQLFLFVTLAGLAFSQGTDFSKIQVKATKIGGNLWTLEGSGGAIGVLAGPDGVFMVDSQFAPLSDKIAAAIKQISDKPIRFMVNTHVHGDHTGGDENFGKMGVAIIARDELRFRLAHPAPGANGQPGTPTAPVGLPMITYTGSMTMHLNGEDVQLMAVPSAHTDGDTLVYFPAEDVLMTGDYFRSVGYPNIDIGNGGSMRGMIDGLGFTIGKCGANTKVIPGHGPATDRAGLAAHRDMMIAIKDKVADMVRAGKTQAEVVAAHPTGDYDAKVPQAKETADRFVNQLYMELKAGKS
jgi:glyoxylase-like metal-dependent hydrolase (beta-lactamase superfamily II)